MPREKAQAVEPQCGAILPAPPLPLGAAREQTSGARGQLAPGFFFQRVDGARSFGPPGCTLSCRAAAIGRHQNSETPGAGHPPGRPFLLAPAVMRATDGSH